ncbi:MAG: chondroitin lyase, partial [Draconibacterium sp.]|nr:chondroitin lyase [Draconibacterium sp.]
CLGAGISCKNREFPVVTTINQCLLRDEVTVGYGNITSVVKKGEDVLENIDWVFQDGIGYVFPKPTTVNVKNSVATGSWWLINKQSDSPKDEVKLDVFKLWLDHGERPSEETYEYIVVPATTIEKLESNISKENVTVISNTPEVQAVIHSGLKMFQAVFYKAGEVQIIENLKLRCEAPGIVIIQAQQDNGVKITVADPNRKLGKMLLSVSTKIEKRGKNFKSVWNEKEGMSEISIDLPQGNYAGSSVTINL